MTASSTSSSLSRAEPGVPGAPFMADLLRSFVGTDLRCARIGYINTGRDDVGLTDMTGADLTGTVLVEVVAERVIGWSTEAS